MQEAYRQADAYGSESGYAEPSYLRADAYAQTAYPSGGYGQQQDPYAADPYAADQYAADPYAVEQPAATPWASEATYSSGAAPYVDPYAADRYSSSGYQAVSMPTVPQNLNSSGFYTVSQPMAPEAPPQVPEQAPAPMPVSAPAPVPVPPEPRPEPVVRPRAASARETVVGEVASADPLAQSEEDVSDWLTFVESRADSRVERTRRFRFRLIVLGVVLAVAGAGTGLWVFLTGGSGVKATETTVLFQLHDTAGNAVGNVLLVADRNAVAGKPSPTGRGAALLIPSELSVEQTGLDTQQFGGAMPTVPPAGKDAVSGLLGIDVDGVWDMDIYTFSSLIDNLSGVIVDVDTTIPGPDGKPLIQPGKGQQLNGAQAAVFATYRAPGEPASKQLARFGEVVTGMLAKVPSDEGTTQAILNQLATVPDPALPNDKLAAILSALAGEVQGKRYSQAALPLRPDGSGALDLTAASPLVAQLLGGAVHSKDEGGLPRVAIIDATGRNDTVSSKTFAASKLLNGGYTTIDSGQQPMTPGSVIEVPNQASQQVGDEIAQTMGLPNSTVKVIPFDATLADAIVVLGQDWNTIGGLPADTSPTPSQSAPDASSSSAGAPNGTVTSSHR